MTAISKTNNSLPAMKSEDLRCMICTKSSAFSDISHLLTHISSKQHLSNQFKLRISAAEDENARNLLERFNSWFECWHMGELLHERQQQKEKKKANHRVIGRKAAVSSSKSRRSSGLATLRGRNISTPRENIDLPHPLNTIHTQCSPFAWPAHAAWSDADPHVKLESDDGLPSENESSLPPSYFLRPRRNSFRGDDSGVASSSIQSSTPLEDDDAEEKELARLKGTVWPGMSLFDSATPDMQRKRNQKKDTNVVVLLQATSVSVRPSELIYNVSGEFLKQREITGDAALLDSPLKGETTPEPSSPDFRKKRAPTRRNREALGELDQNAAKARRPKRRRNDSRRKQSVPYSDDSDDQITYDIVKHKKKNGIRIHRDNSGPQITFDQTILPISCLNSSLGQRATAPSNVARRSQRGIPGMNTSIAMPPSRQFLAQNTFATSHLPPMYDLSAFGQLTNVFQPGVFPSTSLGSFQHSMAQLPTATFNSPFANDTHVNDTRPGSAGLTGFSQTMSNWDVLNTGLGATDGHPLPAAFQGYTGFDLDNTEINPLFLHSDQAFPVNDEEKQLAEVLKKEEEEEHERESTADTISLASDQK